MSSDKNEGMHGNPAIAGFVWPFSSKKCQTKLVLRQGYPELVVKKGSEVEFCAPSDKELFICFDNQDFFGVEHITISKGGCSALEVRNNSKMLKYKYWLADSTKGYKCPKELWVEEQGDPAGGGEMGGGS